MNPDAIYTCHIELELKKAGKYRQIESNRETPRRKLVTTTAESIDNATTDDDAPSFVLSVTDKTKEGG